MKIKRITFIIALCLISAMIFAGCQKTKPVETSSTTETTTVEESTTKDEKETEKEKETTKKPKTPKEEIEEKESESEKEPSSEEERSTEAPTQRETSTQSTSQTTQTQPTVAPEAPAEEQVTEPEITTAEHVHSYSSRVTLEPTCTSEGIMTYTCDCGDSYIEYIPKIDHVFVGTVIQEPTCGEVGYMSYDCEVCGLHDHNETIPATGQHVFAPVYVTETITKYICDDCGKSFDSYEEWLEHSNSQESGHGSCSTKTYKEKTNEVDHFECEICGETR